MNTDQAFLRLLAPVDQIPGEGFEADTSAGNGEGDDTSLLDDYIAALAESTIGFDVSTGGIRPLNSAAQGGVFQRFEATVPNDPESHSDGQTLEPGADAYAINFDALLDGRGGFDDLNDACESTDFVRRFLEIVGPALDDEPEIEFTGRHIPLIRWSKKPASELNAEDEAPGAIVQLLGILQADDKQFDAFCQANADDFALIREDLSGEDEVEGRGIREAALALAVLGVSVASTPHAEAGLFDRLFGKGDNDQTVEQDKRKAVRRTQARVTRSSEGWVDTHNDAEIDHKLLKAAANSGASRQIIVDVSRQRAYLLIGDRVAIDTPVSTARSGKHTPRGTFKITQRVRSGKTSTIYGCSLPYWMRLDSSAIGMHIGDLPGYPASAGCIRLPFSVAPFVFDSTASGTTVRVVDSWKGHSADGVMVADAR